MVYGLYYVVVTITPWLLLPITSWLLLRRGLIHMAIITIITIWYYSRGYYYRGHYYIVAIITLWRLFTWLLCCGPYSVPIIRVAIMARKNMPI